MAAPLKKENRRRNQAIVMLTDNEQDALFEICKEKNESVSGALRKCLLIVLGMPESERDTEWKNL